MDNELERLRAENGLLRADIRLLEAGRETISAQAEACTFRANKNAEAYNEIKAENARLRLLDRQKCGGCGEPLCKDITLCKACVDKILIENAKLRELVWLAVKDLMSAADDNGGCYGCKFLDSNEKCTSQQGKAMCDCKINNMWQWQHADKLKELGTNAPCPNCQCKMLKTRNYPLDMQQNYIKCFE